MKYGPFTRGLLSGSVLLCMFLCSIGLGGAVTPVGDAVAYVGDFDDLEDLEDSPRVSIVVREEARQHWIALPRRSVDVTFTSRPEGAKVYLLDGDSRTRLGRIEGSLNVQVTPGRHTFQIKHPRTHSEFVTYDFTDAVTDVAVRLRYLASYVRFIGYPPSTRIRLVLLRDPVGVVLKEPDIRLVEPDAVHTVPPGEYSYYATWNEIVSSNEYVCWINGQFEVLPGDVADDGTAFCLDKVRSRLIRRDVSRPSRDIFVPKIPEPPAPPISRPYQLRQVAPQGLTALQREEAAWRRDFYNRSERALRMVNKAKSQGLSPPVTRHDLDILQVMFEVNRRRACLKLDMYILLLEAEAQ